MKTITILLAAALAAGCASAPQTPEQRAADQDLALRLMLLGGYMQAINPAPPPPLTIHCIGCR